MKRFKSLRFKMLAIFLIALVLGIVFLIHGRDNATTTNIDYCLAMKSDGKPENAVSVKPCTPSGWWCTSNSQCCSGRCTNNVCE